MDHVYLELEEKEPDEFDLLPFTCIVDPERLRMVLPENADLNLPEDKPDISTLNLEKGEIVIEEIRPGMDEVTVRG